MLFHVSVEADDPRQVAEALAQIWGGEAFPFPPVGMGSWVAIAGDQFGSMIEVYARGTVLHEGVKGAVGLPGFPRRYSATHFAMGSKLDSNEIIAIADQNGWKASHCRRADRFDLIEIWIDGCLMIEVLSPAMQQEYLDTITIENWRQMVEDARLADAA
jgi:hypothetical protein